MDKGYYQKNQEQKNEFNSKSQSTIKMDKGYYKLLLHAIFQLARRRNPQ